MQERLQKILARGGLASRRAAEQLVADGRVRVNGRVVTELGTKADPRNDKIEVDGKRVVAEDFVYAVLHKPRGVVSTLADPEGRPTVAQYLGALETRCYPVGRLDFATSGVLLVTNDGAFSDGLLHPRKAVPKTYVVKTNGVMKPEDLKRWETGVKLEDGHVTGRAHATLLRHEGDKTWFELTISEGKNQQIRRMGVATGFQVMRLSRMSFAGVTSDDLRPGQLRMLTLDELRSIRESYGVPKRVRAPRALETTDRVRRPTASRREAPAAVAEKEPRALPANREERRSLPREDRRSSHHEGAAERGPRREGAPRPTRDGAPARGPRREGGAERGPRREGNASERRPSRDGAPARGPRREGGAPRPTRDGAPARGPRREGGAPERAPRAEGAPARGPRREGGPAKAPRRDDAPRGRAGQPGGRSGAGRPARNSRDGAPAEATTKPRRSGPTRDGAPTGGPKRRK